MHAAECSSSEGKQKITQLQPESRTDPSSEAGWLKRLGEKGEETEVEASFGALPGSPIEGMGDTPDALTATIRKFSPEKAELGLNKCFLTLSHKQKWARWDLHSSLEEYTESRFCILKGSMHSCQSLRAVRTDRRSRTFKKHNSVCNTLPLACDPLFFGIWKGTLLRFLILSYSTCLC